MNGIVWIIYIAMIVAIIAGWWMIFTKAGEDGWKAIIPIWNILVLLKIVGREWWWIILMLIPIVGFVIWIIVALDLAKSYGRGTGFGIGLIIFPLHLVADPRLRQRHLQGAGSSQDRVAASGATRPRSSTRRKPGPTAGLSVSSASPGRPPCALEIGTAIVAHGKHDRIEPDELRDEALERLVQRRIAVHEAAGGTRRTAG